MKKGKRVFLWAALAVYVAGMLWLLFGQRFPAQWNLPTAEQMLGKLSLEPGHTIGNYLWVLRHSANLQMRREAVINLVGNVIMFVPMGYLFGALFRTFSRFWPMLLWSVVIICMIELLQMVTLLGSCDVDDLILNLPGIMIGWLTQKILIKAKK